METVLLLDENLKIVVKITHYFLFEFISRCHVAVLLSFTEAAIVDKSTAEPHFGGPSNTVGIQKPNIQLPEAFQNPDKIVCF